MPRLPQVKAAASPAGPEPYRCDALPRLFLGRRIKLGRMARHAITYPALDELHPHGVIDALPVALGLAKYGANPTGDRAGRGVHPSVSAPWKPNRPCGPCQVTGMSVRAGNGSRRVFGGPGGPKSE